MHLCVWLIWLSENKNNPMRLITSASAWYCIIYVIDLRVLNKQNNTSRNSCYYIFKRKLYLAQLYLASFGMVKLIEHFQSNSMNYYYQKLFTVRRQNIVNFYFPFSYSFTALKVLLYIALLQESKTRRMWPKYSLVIMTVQGDPNVCGQKHSPSIAVTTFHV